MKNKTQDPAARPHDVKQLYFGRREACINNAVERGVDIRNFRFVAHRYQYLGFRSDDDVECIYAGEYDKHSYELYIEALKYFTAH